MNYRQFLFLPLFLLSIVSYAKPGPVQLARIKMFNDKVELKVPSTFTVLHDFEVKKFYPESDPPKVVYASEDRTVRIAFNYKKNGAEQYKLKAFGERFLADWRMVDPKLKELSSGIAPVDGRDMGYVGVLRKSPEKQYRFVFFTDFKGMLLTGELVHPKKGYKPWVEIGNQIMNSVDMKDN